MRPRVQRLFDEILIHVAHSDEGSRGASPRIATMAARVSGFTGACSVSIMNHSKPSPFSASTATGDEEEIQVPKEGARDDRVGSRECSS